MTGSIRVLLIVLLSFFGSLRVYAQRADDILGMWETEEKEARIEIFKSGRSYYGKIVWATMLYEKDGKTLLRDINNPDEKLRKRPILGLQILNSFEYDEGQWTGGKVYDPKTGKTYSSKMKLKNGKLELRGYIGTPLLGRITVWTRVR